MRTPTTRRRVSPMLKAFVVVGTGIAVLLVAGGAMPASATGPDANSISVSMTAASVGQVVVVSGHNAASCVGSSSQLVFLQAGTGSQAGFVPPGSVAGQWLYPSSAADASWSYAFSVPGYLPASRQSGVAVVPGTYRLVNECDGAVAASVTIAVTSSYESARYVAMASTPDGRGYWLAQAGGGVFAYGDAGFYGSLPGLGIVPQAPIVGLAPSADGRGYWLVGADGGVFAFGDARFLGSLPGLSVMPNAPVVGMAATADGGGYWLVGADGGVFAFGDAAFLGGAAGEGLASQPFSAITALPGSGPSGGYAISSEFADSVVAFDSSGSQVLNGPTIPQGSEAPFVGIASAGATGRSVWTAEVDGGVFTYAAGPGTTNFYGSLPAIHVAPYAAITAMASTPDRHGYWLLGSDGGVFAFGDAPYLG